ncbi:hypothetical protein C9374_007943 [Naegleria lovaniensis]|uniref:Kazal-like domain-containing protein n=1 Tax=Naegleria lovaniensis TaxID=51637 RepID=A0AA88GKI3_NAELO|nr:uncharacterized protein C9374_007943 [Naegleria lovaniensis]KAG2378795.1 hypothetical protein C9374_007943 [Naegleria lovaniensis]
MKTKSVVVFALFASLMVLFMIMGHVQSSPDSDDAAPIKSSSSLELTVENIERGSNSEESYSQNTTCCNTCPKPEIIVVPKCTVIKVPVRIPYPVFKPIPRHDETKCPNGYEFVKPNQCKKTIVIKKEASCPIGFVRLSETECLRVITMCNGGDSKDSCPSGYTEFQVEEDSKEYDKLKKLEKQDRASVFFTKVVEGLAFGCKKDRGHDHHFTCPRGYYHQNPYHCVKVVECPKKGGWIRTKDGRCVRTLFKCPKGYKKLGRFGLKCIKMKLKCPKGYRQSKRSPRLCLKTKIIVKIKCPKRMIYSETKKTCIWKKCRNVKCKTDLKCPPGQLPKLRSRKSCCPTCARCECGSSFNPVCTREGVTVFNLCTAQCLGLEVVHEGSCTSKEIQKILKICPPCEQCKNKKRRPVCGVDGVTYPNICVAKCVTSGQFVLKRKGECTKADCSEGSSITMVSEFLPFFERVLKSQAINKKRRQEEDED